MARNKIAKLIFQIILIVFFKSARYSYQRSPQPSAVAALLFNLTERKNMKKIILTSLGALLIAGAANAADMKPYASLKLGYSSVDGTVKAGGVEFPFDNKLTGFVGAIAGGAAFQTSDIVGLRGEVEYSYSQVKGEVDEGSGDTKVTDHAFLLGGYADFGGTQWNGVNPYVGLNVGYVLGDSDGDDASGIAYGVSLGVSYAINKNLAADLGVRYLLVGRSTDNADVSTETLSILLGARYTF